MTKQVEERTLDEALGYAALHLEDRINRLYEIMDEFSLPDPNDIADELWKARTDHSRMEALRSKRYHRKETELQAARERGDQ